MFPLCQVVMDHHELGNTHAHLPSLWTSRKVAISFMKAYKTCLIRIEKQREAFCADQQALQEYILRMVDTSSKYHVIERRKDRRFSIDTLGIIQELL